VAEEEHRRRAGRLVGGDEVAPEEWPDAEEPEEVGRDDAESHADEARTLKDLAEARNQAETLAYSTEKTLGEHRSMLDEETAQTIETRIEELKGVLDSSDPAEIRVKSDALMESAHALAQKIYEQAQAEQPAPANGSTDSDDEVVEEADYEVIDEEAKQ
jgi:molecular chaperone DnaK